MITSKRAILASLLISALGVIAATPSASALRVGTYELAEGVTVSDVTCSGGGPTYGSTIASVVCTLETTDGSKEAFYTSPNQSAEEYTKYTIKLLHDNHAMSDADYNAHPLNEDIRRVKIGDLTIEEGEMVSSVDCRDATSSGSSTRGVTCALQMTDGTTKEGHYRHAASSKSAADYTKDVAVDLHSRGLMSDADYDRLIPNSATSSECTSILPASWCTDPDGGIYQILNLILNIMTMGMGILATIGLVISGIQWLTARDKEDQVVKAKSRIFNIVIGLIVWGIMWLLLNWLLPGGIRLTI